MTIIIPVSHAISHYFYPLMRFTFPKEEKLKREKQIREVFDKGTSVTVFPLKMIYLRTENKISKFQVGFTVPKKNFRKAVERNRMKRLLRESYRLNKHLIFNRTEGSYAFMFLYLGKEMTSLQDVETAMCKVFDKFLKRIDDGKVDP
ncbi:ribonuclease P protein component [Muriicola marianensis]|uniref:Ribonuclease P protein component n=1 Tax=Muriicola marianensis TaxID=1324801 RepID=A0ABQ1QYJ8_9FLAO|nr:ribonuclease P protein component [Muriicola marianensis]GGD50300.1 ribonuclease P protein component [Muriicola marianensis]